MEATNTDLRSTNIKQEMAEHFAVNEAEYRDGEGDWNKIVYEDDEVIVFADTKGYEHSEWQSEFGDGFSEAMHQLARQLTDYSWSVHYPVVFDKLE